MIFFEPTDNFWKYIAGHPWKWRQYHDCGAGAGHLTRLMRERGYSVHAYDLYPRGIDDETGGTLRVMDCTSDEFADQLDTNDAVIIARPCHNNWISKCAQHTFEIGETLYVGLPKNFEMDLDDADLCYEVVEQDVGHEGEDLIRIYCDNAHAKILRLIKTDHGAEEWWWYKPALQRYVSGPWSPAGFNDGGQEVLKEFKRGHDLQMGFAKEVLCNDKLDVGWIAPDGEFFGCHECNHDDVMMKVVGISLKRAEALGFIRCHGDAGISEKLYVLGRGHMDDDNRRPTPAQAKMLRRKGYKVHR